MSYAYLKMWILWACSDIGCYSLKQQSNHAKVAAIVAIHPPKFHIAASFMAGYERCREAREAMDVMLVFSDQNDATEFTKELQHHDVDTNIFFPLIAQSFPGGANPASWKKLEGLAQVLDDMPGYEFALMLDAELRLNDCAGFTQLLASLREKHLQGIWYGDRADPLPHMHFAACAIFPTIRSEEDIEPDPYRHDCGHPGVMQQLAEETHNFEVYTWWNDLPYVHIESAHRMFQHWHHKSSRIVNSTDAACKFHCATLNYWQHALGAPDVAAKLPKSGGPATDTTGMMGEGHGETMEIAGKGFEHLIYQLYMVGAEGFHIMDLTEELEYHHGYSIGERFWDLPEVDRRHVLETIRPLWLPGHMFHPIFPKAPILLTYHMDRFGY